MVQPVGKQYTFGKGPEVLPELEQLKIDNKFLKQQVDILKKYNEMVKYATALRINTADTEAILKQFSKNSSHPTYFAFQELGSGVSMRLSPIGRATKRNSCRFKYRRKLAFCQ